MAERDLIEIWSFVAQDSPRNASAFVRRLKAKFEPLRHNPALGPSRENLAPGLRVHFYSGYAIWRQDFIRAFLERDIPQLGITIPAERLRRFWTMVSHCHGQIWNAAQFARSLGTSENTARSYLDILSGAFMVRILPPWFENLAKRQVKSPKIYLRDSGLLHALLQIGTLGELEGHPKLGASWEGLVLEQVVDLLGTREAYFWATHGGAELDLLVTVRGKRYGFEFKYADAPGRTRSMISARQDLGLEHIWVVYPGTRQYGVDEAITVIPAGGIPQVADSLRGGDRR